MSCFILCTLYCFIKCSIISQLRTTEKILAVQIRCILNYDTWKSGFSVYLGFKNHGRGTYLMVLSDFKKTDESSPYVSCGIFIYVMNRQKSWSLIMPMYDQTCYIHVQLFSLFAAFLLCSTIGLYVEWNIKGSVGHFREASNIMLAFKDPTVPVNHSPMPRLFQISIGRG